MNDFDERGYFWKNVEATGLHRWIVFVIFILSATALLGLLASFIP
jgi:hypothetical protein